jgi:hypothetical protein
VRDHALVVQQQFIDPAGARERTRERADGFVSAFVQLGICIFVRQVYGELADTIGLWESDA